MKTLLTITLLLVTLMAGAQHFNPVWTGNGFSHMNIYIVNADLDNQPIEAGDHIGVFAGSSCVGYTIVLPEYPYSEFLTASIITSMNDGTGNGFNSNDSIVFKIWDQSENKYVDLIYTSYRTDIDWWSTGRFEQNGSAFVSLDAKNVLKKKVLFSNGMNELSLSLNLLSNSLSDLLNPLIDSGVLMKVQNSKGESFEKYNGVWMNAIGELNPDETYTIIVNQDCELEYEGTVK